MRIVVWLAIALIACRKEARPQPTPPASVIPSDAELHVALDASADAPIDAPVDAPLDAASPKQPRCPKDQCWLMDEKRCAVPGGPIHGGVCGKPGGTCTRCRCAAPWTPIDTPDGPRALVDLRVGDRVLSTHQGRVVAVAVRRTNSTAVVDHHAIELVLDDHSQLLISAGHPTADGRDVAVLVAGDRIGPRTIVSAARVAYPYSATYDILPDSDSGMYFSNGVPLGSTLRGSAD